ncbi:hypothetical protein [Legionella cardiaca]|uniref:Dot/Icm T4SS effector n=1 Tax=Legionella cardiaca TaxID=1071983 RepID=A0ABY8ASV1_9GAMM|nr:hypothetical protein [Legionella cardiaca]WED42381.1 hypothetical protein PXX05_10675 [Legionella cardiaca]
MQEKQESEKVAKKKLATSIRPSVFSSRNTIDETTVFKEFLEKNAEKSINAKFLLGTTEFHNFEKFQKTFEKEIPLLKEIIAREASRPEGTFVFYNGSSNVVKFLRMIMSSLYKEEAFKTKTESVKSNLVFGTPKPQSLSPQCFFEKHLDKRAFLYPFNTAFDRKIRPLFDHESKISRALLSASMLLHDGCYGETSWLLFHRNRSISIKHNHEVKFLRDVLQEFCHKKKLDNFPIDTLVDYYVQYQQTLEAQLLQIFVNEKSFNSLGYYSYAGGIPLVKDSASFLHTLYEELNNQSCSNWGSFIAEKFLQAFREDKLYHLVDAQYTPDNLLSNSMEVEWNDFLQVRFLTANPDFYNPEEVRINEFYKTDEAYNIARELKAKLRTTIHFYFTDEPAKLELA